LTFAMARHALVDLAQILSLKPRSNAPDRLPPERYQKLFDLLCQSGMNVCHDSLSSERLREMRGLYEGYAEALSRHLFMPLPPWITEGPHRDDWMKVARLREQTESASAGPPAEAAPDVELRRRVAVSAEHPHDF